MVRTSFLPKRGKTVSNSAYLRLREFLDQFPIGFPQTSSGVEIELLKRLFTEEEARIAVALNPIPEEVAQIAQRIGIEEAELNDKLEAMSQKGLIFRVRRGGSVLYNSSPFMIGLYEYSVMKVDGELARLFKEYYDTAFQRELGASNVPGFKVIPIDENVHMENVLLPFHKLKESIRSSRIISLADCICRKEARLLGVGCDHPIETCLSFGVAAEYYIENNMGRRVTADEAIRVIEEADGSGLVHAGVNAKHLSNLCNCCSCCCASMKGITQEGHNKRKYMNSLFEAIVDSDACNGCESCISRCPVGAITVEEVATVNREKCLGCGLCASVCSGEAIAIHLRGDREDPFDRVLDLAMAILEGKNKTMRGESGGG
jgi:electron transport complex protein RnfB